MNPSTQRGFTLPELLAGIAVLALMLSFVVPSTTRLDEAWRRAQQAEAKHLASLVEIAWTLGRIGADDSGVKKLQNAMPEHTIPPKLSNGLTYDFSVSDGDPRILIQPAADQGDSTDVAQPAVVRPPLPTSEIHIHPWWVRRQ